MKAGKTCRKSAKWLLAALAITAASCVHGYEFVLRRGGVCAAFDGRGRLVRLANENTGHDWAGGGDLWQRVGEESRGSGTPRPAWLNYHDERNMNHKQTEM